MTIGTIEIALWIGIAVTGYTYVLYPVMIFALGRCRAARARRNEIAHRQASVVLVVRNEGTRIAQRIHNLLGQEPGGIVNEIIVVSDGSSDETCNIVESLAKAHPTVRLLQQPVSRGKAWGINLGVESARNDYVVFADARQRFLPDTVARLLDGFGDPTVGAVSGELRLLSSAGGGAVAESVGMYWKYEVWIRSNEAKVDSVIGCSGAVYAAQRNLIQPMPEGVILDDVWTPMHVVMQGKRVAYDGGAVALDEASTELDKEFARKVRTLAGNVQLIMLAPQLLSPLRNRLWWMLISHKLLRLVVPYVLVAVLVLNMFLTGWLYRSLLLGQCLFYALGIAGYFLGGQSSKCRLCGTIKVFLTLNAAAVLGMYFALTGKTQGLWRTSPQAPSP